MLSLSIESLKLCVIVLGGRSELFFLSLKVSDKRGIELILLFYCLFQPSALTIKGLRKSISFKLLMLQIYQVLSSQVLQLLLMQLL
jgi:hypothetical protein